MDDIYYKFLVEDNFANIKQHVSAQQITAELLELKLIDRHQLELIPKLTNDESLEIVFKNLSQYDNKGKAYKSFMEKAIQSKYDWFYKDLLERLTSNAWVQDKYKNRLNYGDFPRKPAHYVERSDKVSILIDLISYN